jgi:hypothetical protein
VRVKYGEHGFPHVTSRLMTTLMITQGSYSHRVRPSLSRTLILYESPAGLRGVSARPTITTIVASAWPGTARPFASLARQAFAHCQLQYLLGLSSTTALARFPNEANDICHWSPHCSVLMCGACGAITDKVPFWAQLTCGRSLSYGDSSSGSWGNFMTSTGNLPAMKPFAHEK